MPNFIFYSWQSDLPNNTNRGLIERALEKASKAIRSDQELIVDPVIDRDTANVPGAPDIGATIFDKIDRASVFVADVSIINRNSKFRPSPNPNVLIEFGYALKALSWQRVVLVANTHFGPPDKLPFDLRQKRVITYHSVPGDSSRKDERDQLAPALERAIRAILAMHDSRRGSEALDLDSFKLDQDHRSVPMPDHDVRDVMGRRSYPVISLDFQIVASLEGGKPSTQIKIIARNSGRVLAQHIHAFVKLPEAMLLTAPSTSADNGYYQFSCESQSPLLPGLWCTLDEISIHPLYFRLQPDDTELSWSVYADNALPNSGHIRVLDIPRIDGG